MYTSAQSAPQMYTQDTKKTYPVHLVKKTLFYISVQVKKITILHLSIQAIYLFPLWHEKDTYTDTQGLAEYIKLP